MTRIVPTIFGALTNPKLVDLDSDLASLASSIVLPCTASGTNVITITPVSQTLSVLSYSDKERYGFVAPATSTASVSLRVGVLPIVPLYKADGVSQCGLGDINTDQYYDIVFLQALNGGGGGFEIISFPIAVPNNPVVHPAGSAPITQGHVLGYLDQNWVLSGDFYDITSSDPFAAPSEITITGVPAGGDIASITLTYSSGSSPQTVSYTIQPGDNRDNVAQGLITAINTNTALKAQSYIANKETGTGAFNVGSFWTNIPVFSNYVSTSTSATIVPTVPITTLASAISGTGAVSIVLTSASAFPSSGLFQVLIDQEVMNVTGGAGTNNWTVARGYSGTTPAGSHAAGANVFGIAALDAAPQWSLARVPVGRPGQANDIVSYEQRNGLDNTGALRNVVVLVSSILSSLSSGFQGVYTCYTQTSAAGGNVQSFAAANGFALGAPGIPPSTLGYGIYNTVTGGDYRVAGVSVVRKPGTASTIDPYTTSAKGASGHGLASTPTEVITYLQCKTVELGYGVGERIYGNNIGDGSAASASGYSVSADANTIFITTTANPPLVTNRSTNGVSAITPANWKIVATPYL